MIGVDTEEFWKQSKNCSKVLDVNYPEMEILAIALVLRESQNVFRRNPTSKRFIMERIRQDS